ncbi:MAG: hypothetical protein E7378_04540 [Clostridiales bacterium]|nr:hypothetical protein [Clostridiales bacterium]
MKNKKFKALLALVIIVGLAVAVYFIFFNKTDSKKSYSLVYGYNNQITMQDVNVATEIEKAVDDINTYITTNSLTISADIQNGLLQYAQIIDLYDGVENQILDNGHFINDSKFGANLNVASQNYNELVKIYKNSYSYLKDTFLKYNGTNHNVASMQTYIEQFYNLFKDAGLKYNNFMYNTGVAYAHGADNTMQNNNLFRLRIECYVTYVNAYASEQDATVKASLLTNLQAYDIAKVVTQDYFNSKSKCDTLIDSTLKLDLNQCIKSIAGNNFDEFVAQVEDDQTKELYQDYSTLVARG